MIIDPVWLRGKTVCVIGLSKNAGKTTTLNAMMREANTAFSKIGLTSIGRDGEFADVASGHAKPQVEVKPGTLFATAAGLIDKCNVSKRLVAATTYATALGDVYIVESLSSGYVQIGGPSISTQLIGIKEQMFRYGCECILIDGAIGRRSLGSSQLADGVVLCTSANTGPNMGEVVEETAFVASLYELPLWDGSAAFIHEGVLNDKKIEQIKKDPAKKGGIVVVDDPSKILCTSAQFYSLAEVCHIQVKSRPQLLAVSVNPTSIYGWNFDREAFVGRISERVKASVISIVGENDAENRYS